MAKLRKNEKRLNARIAAYNEAVKNPGKLHFRKPGSLSK